MSRTTTHRPASATFALLFLTTLLASPALHGAAIAETTPTWTEDSVELRSPDPRTIRNNTPAGQLNKFGRALAVAGDRLVIGHAERNFGSIGHPGPGLDHPERAFVFRRVDDAWVLEATLLPPSADVDGTSLEFSRAVAISPDAMTVVIGAPHAPGPGGQSQAGRAYVFGRDGTSWSLEATLSSPNVGANDRFGVSVAVDGDTVVIGSEGDRADLAGAPNVQNGAAYVFTRSGGTWALTATLRSPIDPLPQWAGFGQQVAISGDTIAVGDATSGSVDVFTGAASTWTLQHSASGVFAGAEHGLAIDGDVLAVGAERRNPVQPDPNVFGRQGEAFLLTRSGATWSAPVDLAAVLVDAGGTKPDWFGGSVAVDGDLVIVGTGRGVGEIVLFEVTPTGIAYLEKIEKPTGSQFNTRRFGSAVAVDGPLLVVAAPYDCQSCGTDEVLNAGVVFTFSDPTRASAADGAEPPGGSGDDTDPPAQQSSPVAPPAPVTWVPTPQNEQPWVPGAQGEMQREGGQPVQLAAISSSAGEVAYVDDDGLLSVVFTGDTTTSVARGLVATREGIVRCEVCGDMTPGSIVEIWAFSIPRLVAAAVVDERGCIDVMVPLSAPLDGGPAIEAGQHTLQVILPMDDGLGRLAVNVGVTVGGLTPTSLPAGEGMPTGVAELLGMLGAALAVLIPALRRGRVQGAAGSV